MATFLHHLVSFPDHHLLPLILRLSLEGHVSMSPNPWVIQLKEVLSILNPPCDKLSPSELIQHVRSHTNWKAMVKRQVRAAWHAHWRIEVDQDLTRFSTYLHINSNPFSKLSAPYQYLPDPHLVALAQLLRDGFTPYTIHHFPNTYSDPSLLFLPFHLHHN